jgi:hypothetical protein
VTRRFAYFTVGLTASVSFLVGMVVTGSMSPSPAMSAPSVTAVRAARDDRPFMPGIAGVVNFADVAERLNLPPAGADAGEQPDTGPSRDVRRPIRQPAVS